MNGNSEFKLAYTINEFCEAAGIGRSKAYLEIKSGRLRAIKIGRRTVIRRKDAEDWLDGMQQMQAGQQHE